MNPPGVVKIHIMLNTEAELRQADELFNFDAIIFLRPPKTLLYRQLTQLAYKTLSA